MVEQTFLYKRWTSLLSKLAGGPGILRFFEELRSTISEQSKLIIRVFPEYTPHDATRHIEQLFSLADRVLGDGLYSRLNGAEMSLLTFGLYSHDWGMAVSSDEREFISGRAAAQDLAALPGEVAAFQGFREESLRIGKTEEQIWEDYLRDTHARRSGQRLRKELKHLGHPFAEMVARVAEGHVLDIRELRDPDRYPTQAALFGEVANVAAAAAYIRLVDLLDIAEDRTPFALWSIVRPRNEISRTEWNKHRALAPIAVTENPGIRKVLITGTTEDPEVFAALADLRSWVDSQFTESVEFLRNMGERFDAGLDSTIKWDIKPISFRPVLLRFEFDRSASLGLLSAEIYGNRKLTFVRELLQNSVDAIDTRMEVLSGTDTTLQGRISIRITTLPESVRVEWTDNGVGMDLYILENYLTKIGRSWYQSADFRRRVLANDPISRFGIGLLSCFAASSSLTLVTRREPRLAKDSLGWHVRIPSRDGYFRVAEADSSVGTTVTVEVPKSASDLTARLIGAEVKKIAGLIKYSVELQTDGAVEVLDPVTRADDPRMPYLHVNGLDEAALDFLHSATIQFNHRYTATDGAYEAFFSCLLPRDLSTLTSLSYRKWAIGAKIIDFEEFITTAPPGLFIKGIASHDPRGERAGGRFSSTTFNVLKPSLVQPDLSRAHTDLGSLNVKGFWDDVAREIRKVIKLDHGSVEGRVRALSALSRIAQIPEDSLDELVPYAEWPVLTLEGKLGLVWRDAASALGSDEVLEAPDELQFVLDRDEYQPGVLRDVQSWTGPTCFVSLRKGSTGPWQQAAASLTGLLLKRGGFVCSGVRLFDGPSDDEVPLMCCVWRKGAVRAELGDRVPPSDLLTVWRKDPAAPNPEIMLRILYPNSSTVYLTEPCPILVPFPDNMGDVAAVGTLFWNQNHPKILALVETLLELSARYVRGVLSGNGQQIFHYLNSSEYIGYVIRSRHSGRRAAIGRFVKLLELAKDEGLPVPKALEIVDFLPGSVGKYWNPYHYPVWLWPKSRRPVGAPWTIK